MEHTITEDAIMTVCNTAIAIAYQTTRARFPSNSPALEDAIQRLNKVHIVLNSELRTCAGRAYTGGPDYGRIEINPAIFKKNHNLGELLDTTLHEIAHILEPKDGHGLRWKLAAKSVGCSATRCHTLAPPDTKIAAKRKENAALDSELPSL